ncbi:MAG: hypothetical protein FWE91_11605 [Defluviitaleaceae bacterium]|nr:hypothetical protein [Defluviitaleaceae bacterium]MCL2836222.1 hypothetical protein [Defluviitaleaceae bacterium]
MDFNIELTNFPSAVHSAIYAKGRGIMPLSRTLDAVTDPILRESCEDLHGFVMNMLSDMYDNPEAYHLPIMKLEEFLNGRDIHDVKKESHSKIKSLDTQVRHAASTYIDLLWRIGHGGKADGDTLLVSEENLQYINKRVSSSSSPITLSKRLEALNRIGLIMETLQTNEYRFTSDNHPGMFLAIQALPWDNFGMLDFRNINGTYKSTHDDYFYPLVTKYRDLAYEIHNFAMKCKMRISTNANWGVVYHYKSKHVMTIWTGCDFKRTGPDADRTLCVSVIGKGKEDACTVVDKYLGKESQDFQNQTLQRMSGCGAKQCLMCSTYSSGKYVTVLGKKHQMCGEERIFYDWHEPGEADMAMIKRLIEIRCEIIDEEQTAKKAKS